MQKIWDTFKKEEEKKKPLGSQFGGNWGISTIVKKVEEKKKEKSPIWDTFKSTTDVGLGISAKAEMGITLPKPEPLIGGLPISKPEEKPKPLFQDPKMIELHKINFESFKLWFKELKESKDKIAFFKGEGQSPELTELRNQYKEKAPYMYEKSEQWIENVSMISIGIGMAWQLVNAAVTSGFKVKDKVINAKELREVLARARAAYVPETGKFKATLSDNDFAIMKQLNVFFKTSGRGTAAREMLEKIVEKTGGLNFPQQVNIFGGKLYAGLPADEIAKSIIEVGKVTAEIVKGLDPAKTLQIYQTLLNTAPPLASEFLKAVEKPEAIPKEEVKEPVNDTWKLTPPQAEARLSSVNMDLYQRSLEEAVELGLPANKEGLKRYAERGLEWAVKALKEEPLKKVTPTIEPKEELKAEVKEPWQMTRAEYFKIGEEIPGHPHIAFVREAIAEGKPVPAEVLADYPDLKVGVKPPTPAIPAEPKEAWEKTFGVFQMTPLSPYAERIKEANFKELNEMTYRDDRERFLHKKVIEQALFEGKDVPEEVLADYPELKAKVKVPTVPKELKVGVKVKFKKFYADISEGQEAEITKKYTTPKGETLLNLYFGENLTGQKIIRKGVPLDIVEISKAPPKPPTIPVEPAVVEAPAPVKEDFEALDTTDKNKELFYEKYNQVYTETQKSYDKLLDEKVADLKEEGFKGVEKGGVRKDEEGYVVGKFPATSKNPKWYRDFYEAKGKAPTNKDLREIAIQQLSQGHTEDYGKVPANKIFNKLEAQLESYETILADIKGGDYSFETPKNITKLDNKLKELADKNKQITTEYEKEKGKLTEELEKLKTERVGKYKELYKEVEVKLGEEVRKGVKEVITGKKLKGLSPEEYKKGNIIIGQIHKAVHDKGLTKKEFSDIKMKYGFARSLSGKIKRMSIEQLQAVLKAVERARPHRIGWQKVVTPKTENKIQSLKDNLIDKLQMTEERYRAVLKSEGVYKEPKYIDSKNFITEKQGKDIIYRLIDEANILRETLPYDNAVKEHPAINKLIDKEKLTIKRDRDKSLKDPKEWNSMRVFAQKMEEIAGVPIYRIYQGLIDISLENKEKLGLFIREFKEFKDILKDEKALKRITDYIVCKSTLKDKPEYPSDIKTKEIKMAKKIEGVLKDYRARARTEKFLDNVDYPEDMPQYLEYKKEIDKAKDIYESKGYDDLVSYMKTQEWGIIKNGYDPLQVVSPKIREYKPRPQTFGKSHIKTRTDIEYHEQERNVIQRLFSYKKSMDNLVAMRPKVKALITLVDENIDKFENPQRVKEVIEVFLRELKGYNRPEGLVERILNRVYAQAMQTIIMPSLVMFGRNCLQNLAFGYDKTILIDPRNKKLSTERIDYMNTYISQIQAMKVDWFMVGEKPLPGLAWLTKIVNKVGIYPYSDQGNRHWGFWAKVNQVDRAFANIDENSTEKQISKAMRGAKFSDIERTERVMALEILAKDGTEAMARYVARCYVADTEFQYNRAERSPMEMGRGKWLSNLMLFPRSYWELLLKQGTHFKRGGIRQKARAFKVLVSIIVGGLIVGEGYKKVTGRRQNPYNPLKLLAYEPGGLAIGTVEALSDVYSNTIMALNGSERAMAALATAVPRLSDMLIPFYDYTLRAIEATMPMTYRGQAVNKNIDRLALRVLRKLATERMRELGWNVKEYAPNPRGYHVERNFYEKWKYIIAGAGVDIEIKEREAKRKAIPKSGIWATFEPKKESKSDVWATFD